MVIGLAALALAASRVPVSAHDLVEMTEIANISVSPDGSAVAFRTARASVACNCTRTAWFVVPVDGKTA
ncbi:hypothetical protein, partial [Sphingomonas sp.]|uniref:hypothetical protein n=1 Tax=Sphingomonas sp. TaxID=28214 RepID=UPI0025EE9D11